MNRSVRVRFAPSPTGALHIGGMRTALFNYLFAKKNGGSFLLRIEDTDQNRYTEGAEEYIEESLRWCGLTPDEGVSFGGKYAPYRQSERKAIYSKYIQLLIDRSGAYYAFDSPEELEQRRSEKEQTKDPFVYSALTRKSLRNSLTISSQEVLKLIETGTPYVVRFKMPEENKIILLHDEIRGDFSYNTKDLDDKVLFKSDGLPTYHLANVVDDYLMDISHVIRGEEWLPSMPLHVLLYEAFGWKDRIPKFAHLPLILKPEGKGKLSKRDGDKLGFPVFPLEWMDKKTGEKSIGYREEGYFPEAFLNMLAFLGWNPGTEKEIYSMEELCNEFSLERVGKSGSKFDLKKAQWFNHEYLIGKSDKLLADLFSIDLNSRGIETNLNLEKIVSLVKDRVNFISEFWTQSNFFFVAPTSYNEKNVKKQWKEDSPQKMKELIEVLDSIDNFTSENTEIFLKKWIEEKEYSLGSIMNVFRIAIVGESKGPNIFDIISVIGKAETINRMNNAISSL